MNASGKRFPRWKLTSLVAAIVAVGLVPQAALAGLAGSAPTQPITFSMGMGDRCIDGTATGGSTVQLLWKNAAGSRKALANVVASPSGEWSFCSSRVGTIVRAGDRIRANDGVSTNLLVVPELTLFQNRVTDIYKGRGPAGDIVKLVCGLSNGFEPCVQTWRLRVNSEGKWSYNPGWNVMGREQMFLHWRSAAGDLVWVANVSPYVVVTIGAAGITGSTRPGSPATVVLKNASTFNVRGTATATGSPFNGKFVSRFLNGQGAKVNARVGDLVTSDIASDADWVVHDIQASANASTDHVTGSCAESLRYTLALFRNGAQIDSAQWWTDEEGSFDDDSMSLASGDRLLVGCQLHTGDWIQKWFTAT